MSKRNNPPDGENSVTEKLASVVGASPERVAISPYPGTDAPAARPAEALGVDQEVQRADSPAARLAAAVGVTPEELAQAFYPGTDYKPATE